MFSGYGSNPWIDFLMVIMASGIAYGHVLIYYLHVEFGVPLVDAHQGIYLDT